MQKTFAARVVVAAASLAVALAGCSKSTDFSITKHYTNVAVVAAGVSGTQHVDLAAEAGSAWSHRKNVKSLDLVGLDATVTRINSGGPATLTGKVVLSRTGAAPVTVGNWSELVSSAPHSLSATLDRAGSQLINDAIKGDGQFDVQFVASSSAPINLDVDVTLHVSMTYKFP
jgi:hypothetical protein